MVILYNNGNVLTKIFFGDIWQTLRFSKRLKVCEILKFSFNVNITLIMDIKIDGL